MSRNIAATFHLTVLADADGDGLPDTWETAYGFSTNEAADAALDMDQDGLTNLAEYAAGTDPTNFASVLRMEAIEMRDGGPQLRFHASSSRAYSVLGTSSLEYPAWERVADVLATATNRLVEVVGPFGSTNAPRYFQLATPRLP